MKTDNNKKPVIAFTIALACVAGIIIAVSMFATAESHRKTELIDLGNRFLNELKYEEAIAAFEEILKIDPKNEEAYEGIINAYIGLGDYEKAQEYAEKGYGYTGSEAVRNIVDNYLNSPEYLKRISEETTETEKEVIEAVSADDKDNIEDTDVKDVRIEETDEEKEQETEDKAEEKVPEDLDEVKTVTKEPAAEEAVTVEKKEENEPSISDENGDNISKTPEVTEPIPTPQPEPEPEPEPVAMLTSTMYGGSNAPYFIMSNGAIAFCAQPYASSPTPDIEYSAGSGNYSFLNGIMATLHEYQGDIEVARKTAQLAIWGVIDPGTDYKSIAEYKFGTSDLYQAMIDRTDTSGYSISYIEYTTKRLDVNGAYYQVLVSAIIN